MLVTKFLIAAALMLFCATDAGKTHWLAGENNAAHYTTTNRDKTGTNLPHQNRLGSQAIDNQPLASSVSIQAEGKGFEQTLKSSGISNARMIALHQLLPFQPAARPSTGN